jgi:hypothetical protein
MEDSAVARSWFGSLLIVSSAVAYSSAGFFTRLIDLDAPTLVFWRGICAGLFMLACIAVSYRGKTISAIRRMGLHGRVCAVIGPGHGLLCRGLAADDGGRGDGDRRDQSIRQRWAGLARRWRTAGLEGRWCQPCCLGRRRRHGWPRCAWRTCRRRASGVRNDLRHCRNARHRESETVDLDASGELRFGISVCVCRLAPDRCAHPDRHHDAAACAVRRCPVRTRAHPHDAWRAPGDCTPMQPSQPVANRARSDLVVDGVR